MSSSVLAAVQAIPADCKAPVFPWESQYSSCFKAGYNSGTHANLGVVAGHGPGPVLVLLLVAVLVFFMFRRGRSGGTAAAR